MSVLDLNTTYHWGVTAENPAGATDSTPPSFSFTTANVADLNGDGQVNSEDLAALLGSWSAGD